MATISLTITTEAHARLKALKMPGDSFSEVILRETPHPARTAGELLDRLERAGVPKTDPKIEAAFWGGRGRRSKRPGPR